MNKGVVELLTGSQESPVDNELAIATVARTLRFENYEVFTRLVVVLKERILHHLVACAGSGDTSVARGRVQELVDLVDILTRQLEEGSE